MLIWRRRDYNDDGKLEIKNIGGHVRPKIIKYKTERHKQHDFVSYATPRSCWMHDTVIKTCVHELVSIHTFIV